jgi:hypothetical protein
MPDRLVYPRIVILEKPGPEMADGTRLNLHLWTINSLTATPVRLMPFERTIYLTARELANDDDAISRWLIQSGVDQADEVSSLVIDLSDSNNKLPDPLAYDASAFANTWCSASQSRTALILMPSLPSRSASTFWKPFQNSSTARQIVVLSNDGKSWTAGDIPNLSSVAAEYAQRRDDDLQREQSDTVDIPHIFKEYGHYLVVDEEKKEYCARYFFDAELAVTDIAQRLKLKLEQIIRPNEPVVLLTHGAQSAWLHRAGLLAGGLLSVDAPAIDITRLESVAPSTIDGRLVIPIFDVVNSGRTCAEVVNGLVAEKLDVSNRIVTVLIDRTHGRISLPKGVELDWLQVVDAEKIERIACVQCQVLHLPFTPPLKQGYQFRSFDFWHMVLSHQWVPEEYGPQSVDRFAEAPDLGAVFEECGDWIAHKISLLVQPDIEKGNLVFVWPHELEVDKLSRGLSARFDDSIVFVRIPRDALDAPDKIVVNDREDSGWRMQLKYIANTPNCVVIIVDEFNGSNTTVHAIIEILHRFGLTPSMYIPFLNRVPDAESTLSLRVRPLYEIPSPRSMLSK